MSLRHFILLLFISATFFKQGFGQDTTKALPEIVVKELKRQEISHIDIHAASPTYKIDAENLRNIGALDIGQAMKQLPGVQIKDYGGAGGLRTISYRSLGATHTAVALDNNLQLNNQTGAINLSRFEAFGLNQLVFTSGQPNSLTAMPSTYLPANLISISSNLMQPDSFFTAEVIQNMNTVNSYETGFLASYLSKSGTFISTQGFAKYGSGEYPYQYALTGSEDEFKRQNADLLNFKARVGLGHFLKKGAIKGDFYYNNSDQQLPGAVILFGGSNEQTLQNEDLRANLNFEHKLGANYYLAANGFCQTGHTIYRDPNFLNAEGFLASNYFRSDFGGGLMLNRILKRKNERIFMGLDLKVSRLVSNELIKNPNRIALNSVLAISKWIGRFKIDANIAHQYVEDSSPEPLSLVENYNVLSPYLGFSVVPFKQQPLHIRAFYKRAYRLPSFNDLYYNFIGNTNLKPEDGHLTNLGMTYSQWFTDGLNKNETGLKLEISLDGYYNYVKDKIVAIPTKDLFNWSMQNIGITEALGIELALMIQKSQEKWKYGLNMQQSVNKTVDITNPLSPSYGHQIPYTPEYSANYGANISYLGYQLDFNMLYSGYRYSLNENIPSNYLDDYMDINIGVQKEFDLKKSLRFGINLKAMNILNKNYEVIRSFPMPGRYYQLTVKFNFK